jgi:hypothetical protein
LCLAYLSNLDGKASSITFMCLLMRETILCGQVPDVEEMRFEQSDLEAFVINDTLNAEEVGKMLRFHSRTIIQLANQGELPGFKVGGQ